MAETANARALRKQRMKAMPDSVEQYLAEWRTLDGMEPRNPQMGWRDIGSIARAVIENFDFCRGEVQERATVAVVGVCEKLADEGRLDVRCGDAGWIWYRQHRAKA